MNSTDCNTLQVYGRADRASHAPGPWMVAKMSNNHDQGLICAENSPENIAIAYESKNSALIAAAPDLLAALERVREAWGDAIRDDTEIDACDLVDWLVSWYNWEVMPALRKARGEE